MSSKLHVYTSFYTPMFHITLHIAVKTVVITRFVKCCGVNGLCCEKYFKVEMHFTRNELSSFFFLIHFLSFVVLYFYYYYLFPYSFVSVYWILLFYICFDFNSLLIWFSVLWASTYIKVLKTVRLSTVWCRIFFSLFLLCCLKLKNLYSLFYINSVIIPWLYAYFILLLLLIICIFNFKN